jgi:hypothetical protein
MSFICRYEFRDAALIGVFTYFGCTLTLSGCYHVVEPDAISQPVPMSFVACLHATAQHVREAAAAVPAPAARTRPPRIMIAGAEKSGERPSLPRRSRPRIPHNAKYILSAADSFSGKTSIAKILGNYAVRLGQKPVRCFDDSIVVLIV